MWCVYAVCVRINVYMDARTHNRYVGCITDSMDMSVSKPLELVMDTEARRPAGHGVPKSQTRLSNYACKLNKQGDNIQP